MNTIFADRMGALDRPGGKYLEPFMFLPFICEKTQHPVSPKDAALRCHFRSRGISSS